MKSASNFEKDSYFEDIIDEDMQSPGQKPIKLSQVLENSLYLEFQKDCMKCQATLREEEILTGM